MSWLKTPKQVFFVKSDEQNPCPICGSLLKVIGSRRRCYFQDNGERRVLMIRRLHCSSCNRIHHELPDLLVPYKRYESQSIEAAVTGSAALTVAADEATISRWKQWFSDMAGYFAGVLISIATRYNKSVEGVSALPQSSLQRIWHFVGDAPRWLARVVRPVANANYWVQTRSAFMSG
mgnify:FL=1